MNEDYYKTVGDVDDISSEVKVLQDDLLITNDSVETIRDTFKQLIKKYKELQLHVKMTKNLQLEPNAAFVLGQISHRIDFYRFTIENDKIVYSDIFANAVFLYDEYDKDVKSNIFTNTTDTISGILGFADLLLTSVSYAVAGLIRETTENFEKFYINEINDFKKIISQGNYFEGFMIQNNDKNCDLLDYRSYFGNISKETSLMPSAIRRQRIKNLKNMHFDKDIARVRTDKEALDFLQKNKNEIDERKQKFFNEYSKYKDFSRQSLGSPENLQQLMYSTQYIESFAETDFCNIRIIRKSGTNNYIVEFPPTKGGDDSFSILNSNDAHINVNDWHTNYRLMLKDEAAILKAAKNAINIQLEKDHVNLKDANFLLAGFSQGGIASAAFAHHYGKEYNIKQIVALGSPITDFNISNKTKVLGFKFENDPVAFLDEGMKKNQNRDKDNWEILEGIGGWHDVGQYADGFLSNTFGKLKKDHNFDEFFGKNSDCHDYQLIK